MAEERLELREVKVSKLATASRQESWGANNPVRWIETLRATKIYKPSGDTQVSWARERRLENRKGELPILNVRPKNPEVKGNRKADSALGPRARTQSCTACRGSGFAGEGVVLK